MWLAKSYDSKITKSFNKIIQQNNSETVTNVDDKEIPKKRYISMGLFLADYCMW